MNSSLRSTNMPSPRSFANVNKQYIVAKYMVYIGYANETAHTMIAELMTHPVVLNKEKRQIRSLFMAPWSESPNMTLKEYVRQLDKLHRAAKNQGVTISDEEKTTHFVGCAKDSGLSKEEWVTRAAIMAANRGGYESAATLCGTRETPALISAPSTVTRAEYDAISE